MWLSHFLKKARLVEILLMTGFVLIAIPFVDGVSLRLITERSGVLFAANFFLLVSVYATNSFFGFHADRINPRLNRNQFGAPWKYAVIAGATLILSLALLWPMNHILPLLGLLSFLLWVFYSFPGGAKARPIWGTAVHFLGQILQFHLCVMAFSEPTLRSLLISVFFSLLFASGHLMHEVKDFESDAKTGIRTNAVAFGPLKVAAFYRAVVAAIPLYWLLLVMLNMLSLKQFAPFFVASLSHAAIAWFGRERAEPGSEKFQSIYRLLYLIAGICTFLLMEF